MPTNLVVMPHVCRKCNALRGQLVDGKVSCVECSTDRGALSDATVRFIARVVAHFGALKEPVVLRKPDVVAKIKAHDEFLKRKFTLNGKTWFGIIEQAAADIGGDEHFTIDPEEEGLSS